MNSKIHLELTPQEAALAFGLVAYADNGNQISATLLKTLADVFPSTRPPGVVFQRATLSSAATQTIKEFLKNTRYYQFDLNDTPLPKGVAAFSYPSSKNKVPELRILKVEAEDATHLSGYVIDVDTLQPTWTYKTFLKARMRDIQRK